MPSLPVDAPATRTVLITGGSRGIGAATALLCARQGWAVLVNYTRDAQSAQAVVEEIRGMGGRAQAVQADVADETEVEALFAALDQHVQQGALPPLGALVNNAGVVDFASRVDGVTQARLQRLFATNVFGSFFCAREAVKRLSTRYGGPGGAIVNLSSGAAKLGSPHQYVDYAATKGAIDTLTIGLGKEVAGEGIRVNGVRAGLIDTAIHASGGQPNRVAALLPEVPLQRAGSADEVAQAIVWLLSDAASYMTASLIDVTGGR
jgi:NAD(P)-dependent dehydrogenase (short-subunit alcohol dehydrogenase family)